MPTYEYQCQDCGQAFEVFATFKQKADGLQPECPQCHSSQVRQAFRPVMLIRKGDDGAMPMPPGGCCPGGAGIC